MGLLRTDILVQFPLVSASFYARNATKPAFVLSLDCFLFGCFGLWLEWSKWSQKHHSEVQIYPEVQWGLYLNSSRFGLIFQECAFACACTQMCVTYISVHKGYYYN